MRGVLAPVVVAVCLAAAVAVGAGVGAAAHEEPRRTDIFGVELSADGDATVYHVTAYDLSDDEQREFYESVADNETALAEWREEVAADLEAAASTGREATDGTLEMTVSNVTLDTYTVVHDPDDGEPTEYGRIEVRAEWSALAYDSAAFDLEGVEGEWVLVTEPFRSGYLPSHTSMNPSSGSLSRVSVHAPPGYRWSEPVDPSPLRSRQGDLLWNPGTVPFSEFYALFTAGEAATTADGGTDDPADDDGGDGLLADGVGTFLQALVLVLVPVAVALLALRRQWDERDGDG